MDLELDKRLIVIRDVILDHQIIKNGGITSNTRKCVNRRFRYASAGMILNIINRVEHKTLESFFNALEMYAQEIKNPDQFPIGISSLRLNIELMPLWKHTMMLNPLSETNYYRRLYNISIIRCLVLSASTKNLIENLRRTISLDDNIAKYQKEFLKQHIDRSKFNLSDEYIDNLKSYNVR